jgi:cbb3-type cytochrome oxidase cytochrome c subunit
VFAFITKPPKSTHLLLIAIACAAAVSVNAAPTSCVSCHADGPEAKGYAQDVHREVGLGCHDCHGGNPDPRLADDPVAAMEGVTVPKRTEIPSFCGRCHSSAEFMKRFNPAARVDQETEYWTSHHGRRLREGDANVATCVDCHSVHGIRRRTNPDSPVHSTRVAETCSRCHSNPQRMASYEIPTDQYARWRVSVHAKAMFDKGDLTAPTCNDCHGNHGATPPGIASVSFVCGQCHAREAELFRASRKHEMWAAHNEMMAGQTCAACHDGRRAELPMTQFTECVSCHENHGVVRPTVAMLGVLPDTPCAFCHEGVGPLSARVAEPEKKAQNYAQWRGNLLKEAAHKKLEGDARFDWLVDRALQLPTHLVPPREGVAPKLRPEFARLFEKFRIGRTHYTYRDVATGRDVSVAVRRCDDCHETAEAAGHVNAKAYLDATRSLTSMIARSERILLAAQRGGVEVRSVRPELDAAVDTQIELETLVHTFAVPLVEAKQKEGLKHAEAALLAGQGSLEELSYRRRGLLIALGIIVLVLGGLALKIRML